MLDPPRTWDGQIPALRRNEIPKTRTQSSTGRGFADNPNDVVLRPATSAGSKLTLADQNNADRSG